METLIGRDRGVGAKRTKQVQGQFDLWQDGVEKVERERRVSGAERGNDVVLDCTNGTFGSVGSVVIWGDIFNDVDV